MNSINTILNQRKSQYGDFKSQSFLSQALKSVLVAGDSYVSLTSSQKEALEMIVHKIARIINGDPNYVDSWQDIAGYASLIANDLQNES